MCGILSDYGLLAWITPQTKLPAINTKLMPATASLVAWHHIQAVAAPPVFVLGHLWQLAAAFAKRLWPFGVLRLHGGLSR
jgi:hypothetical protein